MNTEQLLAYLEAPAQHPATQVHLTTCPSCHRRSARLFQAVLSPQVDHLTCIECQARLPEYVQAQMEGQDPTRLFPDVRDHLALCPSCRRLYRDLLEMDELVETGSLPEPVAYRPPNLSFLKHPRAPEWFGEIVRSGFGWAQDRARDLAVDLGAFFRVPERRFAWAVAVQRKGYEPRELLYQIALSPERLDDLDVEVAIYRQAEKPEVARVVVYLRVPSRLLAGFAGGQVELKTAGMPQTAQTDENGFVAFEDVPLAELEAATLTLIPPRSG